MDHLGPSFFSSLPIFFLAWGIVEGRGGEPRRAGEGNCLEYPLRTKWEESWGETKESPFNGDVFLMFHQLSKVSSMMWAENWAWRNQLCFVQLMHNAQHAGSLEFTINVVKQTLAQSLQIIILVKVAWIVDSTVHTFIIKADEVAKSS